MKMDNTMDTIPHERMIVTLSVQGFIKRVPAVIYTSQHRRGKGIKGMGIREVDAVKLLVVADTHDTLFFFTNTGKIFSLKTYEIPAGTSRTAKGLAVINLFPLVDGERVAAVVSVTDFKPDHYLLMATEKGEIVKSTLEFYETVGSYGILAMNLERGNELVAVTMASASDDVILITEQGQSLRFNVKCLPTSFCDSGCVCGIKLENGDKLVSISTVSAGTFLLIVTANGYGKVTEIEEYMVQSQGDAGIKTIRVTEKTGIVAAVHLVRKTEQLMLSTKDGLVISTPFRDEDGSGIPNLGRNTQGVILVKMDEGDRVVAVASWE